MHLLFEEGGEIRAASVLAQQGEAWQAELPSGKRTKVKSRDVWLQFNAPTPKELLDQAAVLAADIDMTFLWECAPDDEFGFADLAADYFGADADVPQRTALALALHGAPIYFRRKGRGRFQRAPQEQLQAALAGLEKRRQQAEVQAGYEAELKAGRLPQAFVGKAMQLLFKPDKNGTEWKALDAACTALGKTPMRLMVECGGIASAKVLHEAKFFAEHFPKGHAFPDVTAPLPPDDLPLAAVRAFSIDDEATTEIDDALSVAPAGPNLWRIGIHIAAPGLGIARGDALDAIARQRLSTVYFPGDKITMLPDGVIERFTLKEGQDCPALSLYATFESATWTMVAHETRVERVPIATNLRHNLLDTVITEANLAAGAGEYPHKDEIAVLWQLARALNARRQEARAANGLRPESHTRPDYSYYIDRREEADGSMRETVRIEPRKRGAPLDTIVAELMILANSTWGKDLADAGVPGIYRAQRGWGPVRTRMQTAPAPHEGLGVAQYAWSTSPLRRYVDLVNQWQILAVARHGVTAKLVAPFKPRDADLMAIVADFDATYGGYSDHQSTMERYWCIRWLQQESRRRVQAQLLKEGMVRLSEVPLLIKVPELADMPRGTWVMLELMSFDEIALEVSCRLLEVLDGAVADAGALDLDEFDREAAENEAAAQNPPLGDEADVAAQAGESIPESMADLMRGSAPSPTQ